MPRTHLLAALAAISLVTGGPAFAVSDDIHKPLSSPDGTSACTDDPALINDVTVYDPGCVEGTRSLKNQPEKDKADVPPRGSSMESPVPPDVGVPAPAPEIVPTREPR
ncbi:hypothetical protein [Emcibacter sp. SYSU 3D8]|uniref:hypothetical protein n=1 Tax=Emcibacter sp. SYSU 3D8 TaxID=3133969 RepID=UPI0031FE983E